MQKTEHRARLPHLSATGTALCVFSFLIFTTASTSAGEPVMTPVSGAFQLPVATSNVSVLTNFLSGSDKPLFNAENNSSAISNLQTKMPTEFSTQVELEKSVKSVQSDSFQTVRENHRSTGRSSLAFSVQAGYGRIWDEQSMFSKISAGHQETGCAYLGAKISF